MTDARARQAFEAPAAQWLQRPRSGRRTPFGRDCLTLQGHNAAFLHGDRLVLKLPAPTAVALLECGEAVPARMGQRVMRAWVAVALAPEGIADRWPDLLGQAAAHVSRSNPS